MNRTSFLFDRMFSLMVLCAVGGFLFPALVFGQNIILTPVPAVAVGKSPESLTIADFNEDGLWDLATANSSSDDVTILRGNGNGTFQSAVSFGVGKSPMSVASGDLNQDGHVDLVVALAGSDHILVLLGQGDGLFRRAGKYKTGKGPTSVVVRDFDRDHGPDVVVVNSGLFGHRPPFNFSVFLNQGDGTLGPPSYYGTEDRNGMFPTGVTAEDLNGDGRVDLAVTWSQPSYRTPNGMMTVLENVGGGRFFLDNEIPAGLTLSAVTAKDLDADGDQDLVVASLFSDEVIVVKQGEAGYLSVEDPVEVGFSPVSIAVEDLNGDGRMDMVTANRAADSLSILLNDGQGAYHSAGHFGVGKMPTAVAVHDFDGDGFPDLATANSGSDDVIILLHGQKGIPALAISKDVLLFHGNGDQASALPQLVRISNVGLGQLVIRDVKIGGANPEAFSVNDASCRQQPLSSGSMCAIEVKYVATVPGIHQAQLLIVDDAPGGPRSIHLQGERKG